MSPSYTGIRVCPCLVTSSTAFSTGSLTSIATTSIRGTINSRTFISAICKIPWTIALLFLEAPFLLADRDEHFQFFFGHERAAHLRPTAQDPEDQAGHRREDEYDGSHHEGRPRDQPGHAQRHPLGALQGQRLGCYLAGYEHDQ